MKKIVVLSGAGVSAESGISTFRDNGGLWDQYNVEDVASHDGWLRNPRLVLDFYNVRRAQLKDVQPNDAHLQIAALQDEYDVQVITQNVDNLHERAGSKNVLHLHGELTKVRPDEGLYEYAGSEKEVIDVGYAAVNFGDKAPNGRQLRPHIVFFGEAVPNIEKAARLMSKADIVLIVGTSMQVYPAASLYQYAQYTTPIYVIDPKDVPLYDSRFHHIRSVATSGMTRFREILKEIDL